MSVITHNYLSVNQMSLVELSLKRGKIVKKFRIVLLLLLSFPLHVNSHTYWIDRVMSENPLGFPDRHSNQSTAPQPPGV
jgi:hypothetical protein